jgi:hypothetical protein
MKSHVVATIVVMLVLLLGSIGLSIYVWNECRAEGHSFWYCLRLISK